MEISRAKLLEYQEELQEIIDKIPILVQQKQDARAEGDLSENTEFDIASAELSKATLRKSTLEALINDSTIVESDNGPRIGLGSYVEIECLNDGTIKKRILRVDSEGDTIAEDKLKCILGINSALGRAIYNGISGKYTIQTPGGMLEYQVTKIPFNLAKEKLENDPTYQ